MRYLRALAPLIVLYGLVAGCFDAVTGHLLGAVIGGLDMGSGTAMWCFADLALWRRRDRSR